MILLITFGEQRLAITVQPSVRLSGQPASPPSDQPSGDVSALVLGHSLGKALSQMFGARA